MEVPKLILAAPPDLAGCYCKVTRALYGLCHSPRAFTKHLDQSKSADFTSRLGYAAREGSASFTLRAA